MLLHESIESGERDGCNAFFFKLFQSNSACFDDFA